MANCEDLFKLAEKYIPLLHYTVSEKLFPTEAETWFTHCSPDDHSQRGSKKIGTALFKFIPGTGEPWIGTLPLVSCQNDLGNPQPISVRKCNNTISTNPADATRYIGDQALRTDGNYFLDFAGWQDPNNSREGNITYLKEVFANLLPGTSPGNPSPQPQFCNPPRGPAFYVEISNASKWASKEIDVDGRFAPGSEQLLSDYIVLTYHILYPAMEPFDAASDSKFREGQWEAISVFLKVPENIREAIPRFVCYSRSYTPGGGRRQIVRPWSGATRLGGGKDPEVEKSGDHPIVWVTQGTHKNMWRQLINPVTIKEEYPNPALLVASGSVLAAAGAAAYYCAGVCAALAAGGPPGWIGCGACWVVTAIIALIALLLLLFAFLFKTKRERQENQPGESPLPTGGENDFFSGTGPAGGAPSGTPGTPGTESSTVGFILRVIDDVNGINETFSYPQENRVCENPTWWRYAGRWGVQISALINSKWDSGTRLSDEHGRTRTFDNTWELMNFISSQDPITRGRNEEPSGDEIPNQPYVL
ncbi:MAG: hypothetical protein HZA84_01160 [Thaumarchaeota archaeon]|nr:hypothetical protein [Nitrososphaerota archaeon]